jgi:hypothetical protein
LHFTRRPDESLDQFTDRCFYAASEVNEPYLIVGGLPPWPDDGDAAA